MKTLYKEQRNFLDEIIFSKALISVKYISNHLDLNKVIFGVTPIILFEYFNDIIRTKRRCQQKDLQSLHPYKLKDCKSFDQRHYIKIEMHTFGGPFRKINRL